jgi:hypothetical protein
MVERLFSDAKSAMYTESKENAVAIISFCEMTGCFLTEAACIDCPAAVYRPSAKKRASQSVTAYTESFKPMHLNWQARDRMPAVVQTAGISICTVSSGFAERRCEAGAGIRARRSGVAMACRQRAVCGVAGTASCLPLYRMSEAVRGEVGRVNEHGSN